MRELVEMTLALAIYLALVVGAFMLHPLLGLLVLAVIVLKQC
jgi:hypothetical protein